MMFEHEHVQSCGSHISTDLQKKDLDTPTRCNSLSSAWVAEIMSNLAGSVTWSVALIDGLHPSFEMFRRAGPSDVLNRVNCHFLRIYYREMGNVRHHSGSTRFPVLTTYRVPRPSKNANATPTKMRQRVPRARPSRTRLRKRLSAQSVSSHL